MKTAVEDSMEGAPLQLELADQEVCMFNLQAEVRE